MTIPALTNLIAYIVVHGSYTAPGQACSPEIINQWHINRNFDMAGYHLFIDRDGAIIPGRPLWAMGAHCPAVNDRSWGICLFGGKAEGKAGWECNYTTAQFIALESLIFKLLEDDRVADDIEIGGHRDYDMARECPGFNVKWWWRNREVLM